MMEEVVLHWMTWMEEMLQYGWFILDDFFLQVQRSSPFLYDGVLGWRVKILTS